MPSEIRQGDAGELLERMPAGSVQCAITSPPYFGLRDYADPRQLGLEPTLGAYIERLVAILEGVRRVLRADGVLWLNLGDSYAGDNRGGPPGDSVAADGYVRRNRSGRGRAPAGGAKAKDLLGVPWLVALELRAAGWYLRSDVIWSKSNAMPESVTDRPTSSHEHLFLLAKRERYFYDGAAIREPMRPRAPWSIESDKQGVTGMEAMTTSAGRRYTGFNARYTAALANGEAPVSRNRRDVWEIATQPYPDAHFATFPLRLVEPCLLAGSRVGDVVLDPFAGSGTVGVVCGWHGRDFVGLELSPAYCDMARARIALEGRPGGRPEHHQPASPIPGQLELC